MSTMTGRCRRSTTYVYLLLALSLVSLRQVDQMVEFDKQMMFPISMDQGPTLTSDRILSIQDGVLAESTFSNQSNVTGFCSLIPSLTAASIWKDNIWLILNASRHPEDARFRYWQGTRKLLASLPTSLLRKGYKTAAPHNAWKRVIDKVNARLHDDTAETLKIAVLGGSVTAGAGCVPANSLFYGRPGGPLISPRNCAWPFRIEAFLNNLAGRKVVEVHNLATGGTRTDLGIPTVRYWLYHKESSLLPDGPDVIVNAYSTNEQIVIPFRANVYNDSSYENERRHSAQEFLRVALESRPCGAPPLVVTLDDYLGYFHDSIQGEMTNARVMKEISEYYGTMMVSYADILRREIYADTSETIFSAPWTNLSSNTNKHDVHLQMSGHLAVTFAMAYSVLAAIRDYCDDEVVPDMQSLYRQEQSLWKRGFPAQIDSILPPELNRDLVLQNVSRNWRAEAERKAIRDAHCSDPSYGQYPCVFAFLCGPTGTIQTPKELSNFLQPVLTENQGWSPRQEQRDGGYFRKLGFVATRQNASFTLTLNDIEKTVRTVHLYTLKSYGNRWRDSRANFTLTVRDSVRVSAWATSFEIEGTHADHTSVFYPWKVQLGDNSASPGSTIHLKVDLVGGSTFKILVMMFCNRVMY